MGKKHCIEVLSDCWHAQSKNLYKHKHLIRQLTIYIRVVICIWLFLTQPVQISTCYLLYCVLVHKKQNVST